MNAAVRRGRWITIGTVMTGCYYFQRGFGCPNGLVMIWRGRNGCFQPMEFLLWEHLLWAVERRLRIAGLQWVSMASETPREYKRVTLRVLVTRLGR